MTPQDPAIASPCELDILSRSDFSIDAVYGDVECQQHPHQRLAELTRERLVPRWHDDRQQRALAHTEHQSLPTDVEQIGIPITEDAS